MIDRFNALVWRLRTLLRRRRFEDELAEEMETHLALLIERNLEAGLEPEAARRSALLAFGGLEQVREAWRDERALPLLEVLAIDLGFALRILRAHRVFAAVVAATLALCIGGATAVFTVVEEIALNPPPIGNTQRLVWLANAYPDDPVATVFNVQYERWRRESRSFERTAAYTTQQMTMIRRSAERVAVGRVTAQFFSMLGLAPALGRDFVQGEDKPGAPRVAILGHRIHINRFGGSAGIIGEVLTLDGNAYEIVGVLSPHYRFLDYADADVYIPYLAIDSSSGGALFEPLSALAWLKPGVTAKQVEAELSTIEARARDGGAGASFGFAGPQPRPRVVTAREWRVHNAGPAPFVLAAAVLLVLLMACANIAGLQLARLQERGQEMAVRIALGAGRSRLVRQLLTESAILALLGGAAGVLLAWWGVRGLRALAPQPLSYLREVQPSAATLLFAAAVTVACALLCGMIPALVGADTPTSDRLKASGAWPTPSLSMRGAQQALSVLSVGVALFLSCGAGLLLRSFLHVTSERTGVDERQLVTGILSLPNIRYGTQGALRTSSGALLTKARSLPGVAHASLADCGVLQRPGEYPARVDGWVTPHRRLSVGEVSVTGDHFRALGVAVVAGRDFTAEEESAGAPVAIVNETLQVRLFGGESAVGKRIRTHGQDWVTVVGVVRDIRIPRSREPTQPLLYVMLTSSESSLMYRGHALQQAREHPGARQWLVPTTDLVLYIRTHLPLSVIAGPVRAAVADVDRDIAVYDMTTVQHQLADAVAPDRFQTILLGCFASVALLIAAVGVYGMTDYTVRSRTQEIGLRMAVGATPECIIRTVMRQTAAGAALGVALGLGAVLLLGRTLEAMLFDVGAWDPLTLMVASALVFGAPLVASWLSALRVTGIDPSAALRNQ